MKSKQDFSRKEVEAFNKGYRIDRNGIVKSLNNYQRKIYQKR